MLLIKTLENEIKKAKRIAIMGHIEPDADSLSSAISLRRAILINWELFGEKEIDIFIQPDVIDNVYLPITCGENFETQNSDIKYDLAICLDCPNKKRMGMFIDVFYNASKTVVIDHHDNNEKFGDINLIYKSSSTCEVLYIIFKFLKIILNKEIFKLIFSGIITDTVNLMQGDINISSYKVLAQIAENVGNINELNEIKDHFLKNKSKSNIKLLERALHSMKFYLSDKVAIMKITRKDFLESNANISDTLGIVNNAINIEGVYIAILFIKQENGTYYVSVRSKNEVDILPIATAFGGGGSATVAAFTYNNKLMYIKNKLLNICQKQLKN